MTFKKNRNGKFVSYTGLSKSESAFYTLTFFQKKFLFTIFILIFLGFIWNWHLTLIILVSIITLLYFFDILFNLFLVLRSFFLQPEITITKDEISMLEKENFPMYTILCPLYKENKIIPQFVNAIQAIDYPEKKLQVILLLEEDDKLTINTVNQSIIPSYFETVIVPDGLPKTKPKALNYGLMYAVGKYLVIYDAEDVPDPLQLKKAVAAFKKLDKKTYCIQAKLNYYNSDQNILTRLFSIEYFLWFGLVLPGLQSINSPIPLGGTSNHFKVDALKSLKGWDPFNVTEDADLGMRISKNGYKTALIDSYTMEEANSKIINWIRQRSRWIKGYMQTFFVHSRTPFPKFIDSIIFFLIIGGKVSSMLINPIMWAMTISYFAFGAIIGGFVRSLYIPEIFYIAIFSLVIGNFIYAYSYMIALAKKEKWDLVIFAVLIPIYWLFMSIAAIYAFYDLIKRPYFWNKTKHGLYLEKEPKNELLNVEPEINKLNS